MRKKKTKIPDGKRSRLSVPIFAAGLGSTKTWLPARMKLGAAQRASAVESDDEDGENPPQSISYGSEEEKEQPTAEGVAQDHEITSSRSQDFARGTLMRILFY